MGNVLDFIDLDVEAEKVVTYQCLCRVTGTVVFRLVNSEDTDLVYDEVSLSGSPTDMTLVTLRMQLAAEGEADSHAKVTWNNPAPGDSAVSVVWQQAWGGTTEGGSDYPLAGGLANAAFVRTPAFQVVQNTYPWALNALSVKAVGRFQLPLLDTKPDTGDSKKMGWKSDVTAGSYDLQDGEVYDDDWQQALLARLSSAWYMLHQPDRVLKDPIDNFEWVAGREKNVLYTSATSKTLILSDDVTAVAPGTVVRVVALDSETAYAITVESGSSSVVVNQGQAAEFVFFVDTTGKWLVTQIAGGAVLS